MITVPLGSLVKLWLAVLGLCAVAGCVDTGTENPLPEQTRMQMPDLRGIWTADVTPNHTAEDESDPGIIVVSGLLHDQRGCMTVRVALFDGNGNPSGEWWSRSPYLPDWTWCAYRIADLIVVEQQVTSDETRPIEHALLDRHGDRVRWCYVDTRLWDYTPESARRELDEDQIITLPSEAVAALIAEHAEDLKEFADRECTWLRRMIPPAAD